MSNLGNLLSWGIENSDPTAAPTERKTQLVHPLRQRPFLPLTFS